MTECPANQDQKLVEILERFITNKSQTEETRKELCIYICLRMLTEEANFETEESAQAAFAIHYNELLIPIYQRIIYPDADSKESKRLPFKQNKETHMGNHLDYPY